jgi:excisionase family DNA binding protein
VERETISIRQACELVSVSRRTIYNWLANGKIEYVRTAGGSVRIFIDTLWRDPVRRPRFTNRRSPAPATSSPEPQPAPEQPERTLDADESDILTFD